MLLLLILHTFILQLSPISSLIRLNQDSLNQATSLKQKYKRKTLKCFCYIETTKLNKYYVITIFYILNPPLNKNSKYYLNESTEFLVIPKDFF